MSKVLDVVERILEAPGVISDLIKEDNEFYFKYKEVTFSCARIKTDVSLYLYPTWSGNTSSLASIYATPYDPEVPDLIKYEGEGECAAPFKRLYSLLEERYFKVNDIFDDLLGH